MNWRRPDFTAGNVIYIEASRYESPHYGWNTETGMLHYNSQVSGNWDDEPVVAGPFTTVEDALAAAVLLPFHESRGI